VMLAIKQWRLVAMYAAFTLMMIFTSYIIAILQFSEFIPCSCGGILQSMSSNQHMFFNMMLIVLSSFGILLDPSPDPVGNSKPVLTTGQS